MPGKGTLPRWDEARINSRTRILLQMLAVSYIYLWAALLYWIFTNTHIVKMPVNRLGPGIDLNLVLAPVLVLAALNELIVARVFDLVKGRGGQSLPTLGMA